jgi:hypothetical protein
MNAISFDKRLFFRIACFAIGVVGTFVFLKVSGVQRVNGWILLVGWLLVPSSVWFFSGRRTQ